MKTITYIITALMLITSAVYAEPSSLKGLSEAKFVVDLNQGSGQLLALRLRLIMETMDNIAQSDVKPDTVIAVRGQASRFMTMGDRYLNEEDRQTRQEIQGLVAELKKRGARLEQCAIALRLLKIDPADIDPDLTVVQNGYVSLIGYQNQGYAMLPME